MNNDKIQVGVNLKRLQNELKQFIEFFEQGLDYTKMIYPLWDAKDILGHVTYWHESFARNISDLAQNKKPNPLKGKLSEVNKVSTDSTKTVSIQELIGRLHQAQKTIEENIFDKRIEKIPYKKGSRDYSRCEHLDIVVNHIWKHLTDLRKSYAKT